MDAPNSPTLAETAHPVIAETGAEHSALDFLDGYVGSLDGALWHPNDSDTLPPKDAFAAAVLDDQRRELVGLTKREWQQLDADQKTVAIAAGSARWR